MAWNKRGQEVEAILWWFVFLYLPLTVMVIAGLIEIPRELMGDSLQPVPLDQAVQARQLNSRLWVTNAFTGRTSPFEYGDDLSQMNRTITKKQMGYRVSMDGKEVFYQKSFYDIAKPIAPFRYLPYSEGRVVNVKGTKKILRMEEYYPRKYELKPT